GQCSESPWSQCRALRGNLRPGGLSRDPLPVPRSGWPQTALHEWFPRAYRSLVSWLEGLGRLKQLLKSVQEERPGMAIAGAVVPGETHIDDRPRTDTTVDHPRPFDNLSEADDGNLGRVDNADHRVYPAVP